MRHATIAFAVPALLSVASTRGMAQNLTAVTANTNLHSALTAPAATVVAPSSPLTLVTPSVTSPATSTEQQKTAAQPTSIVGPTADAARAGVAPRTSKDLSLSAAAEDKHMGAGQNVAMMIVGGAALITGLIIGGDGGTIVAIGGAAVGLVGLYNYVK